jgi:hypothetical protein
LAGFTIRQEEGMPKARSRTGATQGAVADKEVVAIGPEIQGSILRLPHAPVLPTEMGVGAGAYTLQGTTANFNVYFDNSLGANGAQLAEAVLISCEREYAQLRQWFGLIPPGLPFNVYIDPGSFGAYHASCAATELHIAAFSGTNADLARLLVVAEADEVCMAASPAPWNCGDSAGEGLSRVLATELYPAQLDGFTSAASWLDSARPDFITASDPTDRNYVSTGSATLFLNFLRYELSYSFESIIKATGGSLGAKYKALTGSTDAWPRFRDLMQAYFPTGTPCGLTNDNPFPVTRHGGRLVQSTFGSRGNFEVVQPGAAGGLVHYWRNNDVAAMPWSGPTRFGGNLGAVLGASMIQGNYGSPGNLEVVAVASGQISHIWREGGPWFAWHGPYTIAGGVAGTPALIQSKFGTKGNFEAVVPSQATGLLHFWRNNDIPAMSWSSPTAFGAAAGKVDTATLIQSNFGKPGNLEVIARVGNTLMAFWRDSGPSFTWHGPYPVYTGARGTPSLIQSRFGKKGNFELVAPNANDGLIHMWRNNDDPNMPWSAPTAFGAQVGPVDEVTVIQSNYGDPGNLEVTARVGDNLFAFWRDSGPAFNWSAPVKVEINV